jgi:hypothetical protein
MVSLPPPPPPPLLEPPLGGDSEDELFVVVELAPATDGEFPLPPHAAAESDRQSAAAEILSASIRVM